ncbi:IclR family transcriptional regulator [Microbacterium suwonense]|uniref:IclR family transcriptional regulator n=1 Tax=Microbacterium suwonense TaxID=683047 RepID=A0ABN6X4F9_9MICO|nr:IclR family transcriptional regulator [Microbacterium suwonense]BDZ39577.1 IclR family transcriptional regulator [Microbacterium suwonense]
MAIVGTEEAGLIRSADRALQLLDAVGSSPDGLTAGELAERLALSHATIYRLLGTLAERDYLVRTEGARYILGRAVDDLGRAVRTQLVATSEVRGILTGMHSAARAPAYLTVFRGDDIAVAHVADSPQHPRIGQLHVGFTEAAHVTAFGKIMLAERDDAALRRYLERHGAAHVGPRSVTSEAGLRAQLDEVRAQQVAVEVDEYMPHLACIAAPVRSRSGRTVGAVSLSTSTDDFTTRAHELEKIVRRGAWHVSSSMPA